MQRSVCAARAVRVPHRAVLSRAAGNVAHIEHRKNEGPLKTSLRGRNLLQEPGLNKGAAFTKEERIEFGLEGLLPFDVSSLDVQVKRAHAQLNARSTALAKYTFLASLRDQNTVLYYNLVLRNLSELLPILYTPTVGEAITKFSSIFRRPDGLFLSYPDRHKMEELMLAAKNPEETDLIVVTDSEGILGLGDCGVGGILICIGKSQIYTLGGGVHPRRILPIVLDVGTNNQKLLSDPLYLGWRNRRLVGKAYDDFLADFHRIVRDKFPNAFLHCEDFGVTNANRLLEQYRPQQSVFNDDIQGTAAVVLAALLSACRVTKQDLSEQRIVQYGFGSAGYGIANGIRTSMLVHGMSEKEASSKFWAIDRAGLLHNGMHSSTLRPWQGNFLRDESELKGWEKESEQKGYTLLEVVKRVKPTVLIGSSTHAGAFTQEVIEEMSKHVERPIIMPLSNPTELAECQPADANLWSNGKGLFVTGSPFPPIKNPNGKTYHVGQSNNALVYPAFGLGVILSKASRLTDGMITAGVNALADLSPAIADPDNSLLPSLADLRRVSVNVATAVANAARAEGLANDGRDEDWTEDEVRHEQWDPHYRKLNYDAAAPELPDEA